MIQVRAMMDFVALHQIKTVIEEFPFTGKGVSEAFERLKAGTLRYRAVLSIKA